MGLFSDFVNQARSGLGQIKIQKTDSQLDPLIGLINTGFTSLAGGTPSFRGAEEADFLASQKNAVPLTPNEVFRRAAILSGHSARFPFLDIEEELKLDASATSSQQERLKNILSLFKTRMGEVQEGALQPEQSQTRLSLVQ